MNCHAFTEACHDLTAGDCYVREIDGEITHGVFVLRGGPAIDENGPVRMDGMGCWKLVLVDRISDLVSGRVGARARAKAVLRAVARNCGGCMAPDEWRKAREGKR